jgi:OmpA-OmpF porin, OOP family
MKLFRYVFLRLALALVAVSPGVPLHAQDREGCKDSPLITRMPGSTLYSCKDEEFDQADFTLADGKQKHVEGEYHELHFATRQGSTQLQIFRNIEAALKSVGWTIDYDPDPGNITAHMGKVWLEVSNAGTQYSETFVTEKGMAQEVVANAAALSSGLASSGHAVVPGIYFDTGKAVVKPESAAALKEVVKLLQQDPKMKVYVVGHTDNVGALTANMELSRQRAAAVVHALGTQYGVAAARLSPYGDGPYAPVTSNDTEDGRSLNRRVELVKQ